MIYDRIRNSKSKLLIEIEEKIWCGLLDNRRVSKNKSWQKTANNKRLFVYVGQKIGNGLNMRKGLIAFIIYYFFQQFAYADETSHFFCNEEKYTINSAMLGQAITILKNGRESDFCEPEDPILVRTKQYETATEIWCIKHFLITPNTKPYVKTVSILNIVSKRLYSTEYAFYENDWRVINYNEIKCGMPN